MGHALLKFVKNLMTSLLFLCDVIFIFMYCTHLKLPQFSSDQAQIWFGGRFWDPDFKLQLKN